MPPHLRAAALLALMLMPLASCPDAATSGEDARVISDGQVDADRQDAVETGDTEPDLEVGADVSGLDTSDFDGAGFSYLVAEPTTLNFGIRPVGDQHTMELEIENAGNRPLTVDSVTLVGSSDAFSYNISGPFELDPGARQTIMVTFFVLAEQTYDDLLRLTSDSASGAQLDIPVSGGGIVFECVDLDGDGRGPYCDLGDDCNQADATIYEGAPEVCNHIDDDCDGQPDEDFPQLGDVCTVGVGACVVSDKWICAPDGGEAICNVEPLAPTDEVLGDDVDNDCDGKTDEELDDDVGCADGEREGFVDTAVWPDLAACAGAWSVGGVVSALLTQTCGGEGGDDFADPTGAGCNVSDLCAQGWHVCASAAEVGSRSITGCEGAAPDPIEPVLFIARQSGTGCGQCATGTSTGGACNNPSSCLSGCEASVFLSNDVFGCGSLGASPHSSCAPLDAFSHNNCNALLPPWACSGSTVEAANVVKSGPEHGGVLCCRDD